MNTGCLTQVGQCHTSQLTQTNKTYLTNKKFLSVEPIQKSQPSLCLLLYTTIPSIHAGVFGSMLNLSHSHNEHTLCHSSLSHRNPGREERAQFSGTCPSLASAMLWVGIWGRASTALRHGCTKAFSQIAQIEFHRPWMPAWFCGSELYLSSQVQSREQLR